jgi:hypothetical protein
MEEQAGVDLEQTKEIEREKEQDQSEQSKDQERPKQRAEFEHSSGLPNKQI